MGGKTNKLVYGVGVNDSGYTVKPKVNGKTKVCPFYRTWQHMLERCYSQKYQKANSNYLGCHVTDDWLIFSNFKNWMQEQDWSGKQLDKDLLIRGNKVYSPETCAFIDQKLNKFITENLNRRGGYPIGVCFNKSVNKFMARCSNGEGEHIYLGLFENPDDAHKAWLRHKYQLALNYANQEDDSKIKKALVERYLNYNN